MMKFLLSTIILVTLLLSPFSNANQVQPFQVETHYQVIRDTPSKTPQLTEHFSLYCVHCFHSEILFRQLKTKLTKEVKFSRSHVNFLPQNRPKWANTMTFAFATAQILEVEDQFVESIFNFHFNNKMMLGELSDLRDVFSMVGVDKNTFDNTISSPQVLEKVKAMVNSANADQVRFTPDLIVNNKYRVLLASISNSKNPEQELLALVNFLLTNP